MTTSNQGLSATISKCKVLPRSDLPDIFWMHPAVDHPITFTQTVSKWSNLPVGTLTRYYRQAAPNRRSFRLNRMDFQLADMTYSRANYAVYMDIVGLTVAEFVALCSFIGHRCAAARAISGGAVQRTVGVYIEPPYTIHGQVKKDLR